MPHGVRSINSDYTVWTVTAKNEEWIHKEKSDLNCEGCEVGNLQHLLVCVFDAFVKCNYMYVPVCCYGQFEKLLWTCHSRPVVYNWSSVQRIVAHIYNMALAVPFRVHI